MQDILLKRLQNWYLINCDGNWEHSWGLSITTLDNPGWTVKINLEDTALETVEFERRIDNGDYDWMFISIKNKIFEAACDPTKLSEVLSIFLDEIIPKYANPDFQYEVYIQLKNGPIKIWRPVKAKLVSEDTLQITHIPDLEYKDIRTLSLDDLTFKKDDIFTYKTELSIGDNIQVELVDTFNGTTITAKE